MGFGIIAVGGVDVRAVVGRFFCAGVVLMATAVWTPPPSVATVDCTFSETALRSVCTSDTDGDTVTRESFDDFPEPDDDAWVVIDVQDDDVDVFDVHVHFDDDHEVPLRWRVAGDLNHFELSVENVADLDVIVDLSGDINDPTDERNSATIANWADPEHTGRVEGINSGSIRSTGDGPGAYGLRVSNRSVHSSAEAKAVNRGTIETFGTAARGIRVQVDGSGTSTAINEGTVTTRGGLADTYAAHAISVDAGSDGTATAINASGATITTEGAKASGLRATIEDGSNGSGTATVTNETGATITTSGRGVIAVVEEEAGTAIANNHGTILTTGDTVDRNRPYGVYARVRSVPVVGGEARAFNSGTVETRGTGARGVRASVDGPGNAVVVNEGSVTTGGGPDDTGFAAHAVNASADLVAGTARAINEDGATITATGAGGRGLQATGGTAFAANNGVVLTKGDGTTFGVWAFSESTHVGSEARAINNGTVETHGVRALGVGASIRGSGTAVATNEGTVSTRGGPSAGGFGSHGMFAGATDSTALVTNRGTVDVRGKSAAGMFAYTRGAGTAQVVVDGGTVRASYDSTTNDVEDGIGILGRTDSGSITARIQRGSLIEAPVAARFIGGPADVIVDGSTIRGAMLFDQFNDTLSVLNSTIAGDVDFGGGANTLVIQSSIFDGAVTGLSDLYVRGSGIARFNRDVTFSGSSATIEDGTLMFAGDFNLGPDGTMTIYDRAKVTAVLTDDNKDDPPQITAGGGIFSQDAQGNQAALAIYLQADETVDQQTRADQATIQQMAQNLIAEGTPITAAGEEVALRSEQQEGELTTIGSIAVMADGSRGDAVVQSGAALHLSEPEGSGTESCSAPGAAVTSGGGALFLAALLSGDVDLFNLGASHFYDTETGAGQGGAFLAAPSVLPGTGWRLANWTSIGGSDWSRAFSGKVRMWRGAVPTAGFDARFGNNFSIDVSASRDLSMSLQHNGAAGQLDGGRYVMRARWRGERLLAGASISQGDWRGRTAFANPVVGGGLAGAFDMNQTHAQAGVGARFDLGGLRLRPSATLFSGRVQRGGYTARGEAFRAAVPETTQRYRGWRTTLRLSPSDWLNATGTVRWRPVLDLSATRTHSAAAPFTLQQIARTGTLGFTSVVHGDAMPRNLLAVGVSVDAMISERWSLRVGYAGMLVDEEPEHGVSAGLQIRF